MVNSQGGKGKWNSNGGTFKVDERSGTEMVKQST